MLLDFLRWSSCGQKDAQRIHSHNCSSNRLTLTQCNRLNPIAEWVTAPFGFSSRRRGWSFLSNIRGCRLTNASLCFFFFKNEVTSLTMWLDCRRKGKEKCLRSEFAFQVFPTQATEHCGGERSLLQYINHGYQAASRMNDGCGHVKSSQTNQRPNAEWKCLFGFLFGSS